MNSQARIGLIGLDTSHAPEFTELLNDPHTEHHVPGGRVVAAFPGGSPDFPLSSSRVEDYTDQLRQQYDVTILDSPAAVAEPGPAEEPLDPCSMFHGFFVLPPNQTSPQARAPTDSLATSTAPA